MAAGYGLLVADKDLQIRGESSTPWDKGGGGRSQKEFFWPFGPQFGLKIRGSPPPPGPSPGSASATAPYWKTVPRVKMSKRQKVRCDPPAKVMTDVHVWHRHLSFNCLSIAKTKRERIFLESNSKVHKTIRKNRRLASVLCCDVREEYCCVAW